MKLYKIVNAGASLRRLITQELSLKTAYHLRLLVDQLNGHLGYFDENRERISKLADHGDAELDALLQEEVDISIHKVRIRLDENVRLSVEDIMRLEGFVDFVDAGCRGSEEAEMPDATEGGRHG